MIYLDNSASTFIKPKEVIKAVNDSLLHYSANPGRSGHKASIKTAMQIEEARERLANHYGLENGKYDDEGRVITLEYDNFYYVACYVPNAGDGLKRMDYRMVFEEDMLCYLLSLKSPCGISSPLL